MKKHLLIMAMSIATLGSYAQTVPGANNLVGYAKLANVAGGRGATPRTVRTFEELKAAVVWNATALNDLPKIILVEGTIAPAPIPADATSNANRNQQINISSNTTIIGRTGSVIQGVQLYFKNGVENIILRNLNLQLTANANTNHTLLSFDAASPACKRIWIDHCEFSNPANLARGGVDAFLKVPNSRSVDSVTVSWCKFSNAPRGAFTLGIPNTGSTRRFTIHHNYFDNSADALIFTGGDPATNYGVDIFNNYFSNFTSTNVSTTTTPDFTDALGIKSAVCASVQSNVFDNVVIANNGGPITLDATSQVEIGNPNSNLVLGNTAAGPEIGTANLCTFAGGSAYLNSFPAGLREPAANVKSSTTAYAGAKITNATVLSGGEQDPTGVEEEMAFDAGKFYPNPFTNEFNISIPKSFQYQVLDFTGRILEAGNAGGEAMIGQNFPAGVYFIKLIIGNSERMIRTVKK